MFIKNRVRSGLVVGSVERVCCSAGVAAVLAGVLLIVVAIVGARVGARVGAVLDENWRGTYDILVMPRGQDFNASETEGLVEPNFVATSGMGGITEAVLAEVRAISGVEVAAPIGMVGSLRRYALGPILYLADDLLAGVSASFDGALTAQLRVTSVLFDAAGDSSEVLSSGEGRVWLPARPASDIPSGFDSEPLSAVGVPEGFSPIVFGFVTGSVYAVPLGMLPAFASVVLAVDPVAEMQLLGRENAEFLDRLVRVPFERKTEDGEIEVEWVSVPAERTADMTWSKLVKEDVFALPQIDIYGAADEANRTGVTSQVVPLVVNSEPTRKLVLRLEVALAEGVAADTQLSSEALRALPDESFTPFATLEVDISDSLVPFSDPGLTLPFPGTILPPGKGGGSAYIEAASLEPMLVGRPSYVETATHGDSPAFEVMPKDVVGSDGLPVGDTYHNNSGMDSGVGLVRAYRSMTGVGGVSGVLPAPLGTFMSADLNDPSSGDASYVALGFSDTTSTWRNSSSGEQEEVLANLSGVDFITMAPGAFTDLLGGAALRGATPIDAIRVRVAGITGYTPEAQQRIIDVAEQIELLGLDATVVAGSSPQSVSLFVSDYFVDRSEMAADLGWVSQEWSSLGASVTVETALSGTTLTLAVVALVSSMVGLSVTTLTNARGLRPIVAVLGRLGWRSSQIRKRLAVELAPPYLLIVASGLGCFWFGPHSLGLLFAAAVGVAVVLWGIEILSGMREESSRFPSIRSDARPVTSVAMLSWRLLMSRVGAVAITLLGSAGVAGLATLTVVAVRDGRERAGVTRLAALTLNTTESLIIALGTLGAGSAILLLWLAHQAERRQLSADALVLSNIGFTPTIQNSIVHRQELMIAVGSSVVSALAIGTITVFVGGGWFEWIAGAAVQLAVIVTRMITSSYKATTTQPTTLTDIKGLNITGLVAPSGFEPPFQP